MFLSTAFLSISYCSYCSASGVLWLQLTGQQEEYEHFCSFRMWTLRIERHNSSSCVFDINYYSELQGSPFWIPEVNIRFYLIENMEIPESAIGRALRYEHKYVIQHEVNLSGTSIVLYVRPAGRVRNAPDSSRKDKCSNPERRNTSIILQVISFMYVRIASSFISSMTFSRIIPPNPLLRSNESK